MDHRVGTQDLMSAPDGDGLALSDVTPLSWREVVTGTPRSVWAITAMFGLLLCLWSVIVPIYDAPDEPQHVDLVRMASQELLWPDPDERTISNQVIASMYATGFAWDPANAFSIDVAPALASEAVPRRSRPTFDELGPDTPSNYRNQLVQHPPTYYWLTGLALRLVPGADGLPSDMTVGLLRLFSALFLLPLPVLMAAGVRRLVGPTSAQPAAALLPLAIPQFTHMGAVVSNDTLLILATTLLTVVLIHVLTGDFSRRTGVWAGICLVLALWSKGMALVLPLWVGLAYLVTASRRGTWKLAVPPLAIAAGLSVLGGVWWLRNLVRYGVLQPRGYQSQIIPEDFTPRFSDILERFGEQMPQLFWGSFGWVEMDLSGLVVLLASLTTIVLTASAFRGATRTVRGGGQALGVLLAPLVLIAGVVLYGAWSLYLDIALFTGMQGRYLFPAVPALCIVAAIGLVRLLGKRRNFAPLVALLLAGMMQFIGAREVVLNWYGPWGVFAPRASVESLLGVNPWPLAAVVLLGVAFVIGGTWTLIEMILAAREAPTQRTPTTHQPG